MSLPTVKSALCPVLMRVPPLLLHSSASLLPLQGEAGCLLPGTVVSNAPAVTASVHVSVERVSPSSRCARGRQRGQQPHGWDLGLQSIPTTFCFSLKKVLISLHYLETLVYFLLLDQNPGSSAQGHIQDPLGLKPSCYSICSACHWGPSGFLLFLGVVCTVLLGFHFT